MSKLDEAQKQQIAEMMGMKPEEVTIEFIRKFRKARPHSLPIVDSRPGREHLEVLSDEQVAEALAEFDEFLEESGK